MTTKIQVFLRKNPVFTYDTFAKLNFGNETNNQHTIKALLAHHIRQGHIVRIRRGLFASIPVGADPNLYPVNPYLIAGYATPDAIIAYHSALSFYQVAYSMSYRFLYLTCHQSTAFDFRSEHYQAIKYPPILIKKHHENYLANTADIEGINIKVTSLERTLVDVLDKPKLGGGFEEIWRSLDMIERIKIDKVVEYALLLGNATTIAKVAFYLSQRRKDFYISDEVFVTLKNSCPKSPHYIDASAREDGKFIEDWNIVVPMDLVKKTWEE